MIITLNYSEEFCNGESSCYFDKNEIVNFCHRFWEKYLFLLNVKNYTKKEKEMKVKDADV